MKRKALISLTSNLQTREQFQNLVTTPDHQLLLQIQSSQVRAEQSSLDSDTSGNENNFEASNSANDHSTVILDKVAPTRERNNAESPRTTSVSGCLNGNGTTVTPKQNSLPPVQDQPKDKLVQKPVALETRAVKVPGNQPIAPPEKDTTAHSPPSKVSSSPATDKQATTPTSLLTSGLKESVARSGDGNICFNGHPVTQLFRTSDGRWIPAPKASTEIHHVGVEKILHQTATTSISSPGTENDDPAVEKETGEKEEAASKPSEAIVHQKRSLLRTASQNLQLLPTNQPDRPRKDNLCLSNEKPNTNNDKLAQKASTILTQKASTSGVSYNRNGVSKPDQNLKPTISSLDPSKS